MKYEELYIYLVDGVVEDSAIDLGPFFIGNWVEETWSFLFFSRPSRQEVAEEVEQKIGLKVLDEFFFTYEQWHGDRIGPIKVGQFSIVPSWEEHEIDEGGKTIFIDPGVVFGSGLHPTTRDSLILLQELYRYHNPKRVLDVGTGTGILAIAAACLGAERVIAIDLNPLCVRTAFENVNINSLTARIEVLQGRAEEYAKEPVDLVIANIHYGVMENLFAQESFSRMPWYILSGLMRSEFSRIEEILREKEIDIVKVVEHEMTWFTILANNRV